MFEVCGTTMLVTMEAPAVALNRPRDPSGASDTVAVTKTHWRSAGNLSCNASAASDTEV